MITNFDIIRRKDVQGERIDGFVSLRKYILAEDDGQRFLLLELNNDRNERLNAIKLEVMQTDADGVNVGTLTVEFNDLSIRPNSEFILNHRIALARISDDFEIKVLSAGYGSYTYSYDGTDFKLSYRDASINKTVPEFKFVPSLSYDNLYGYNPVSDYLAANVFRAPFDLELKPTTKELNVKKSSLIERLKNTFSKKNKDNTLKKENNVAVRRYKISIVACLLVALILSLFAIVTYVEVQVFKENNFSFTYGGIEYSFAGLDNLENSDVIVVGISTSARDVTIEDKVLGHKVVSISAYAFSNNKRVKKVTVEGPIAIRNYAFYGNTTISEVRMDDVTEISDYAFSGCVSLKKLYIPNVEKIGAHAFSGCTSLPSFSSGKLTEIGTYAFRNCDKLESLSLYNLDAPIKIGFRAFNACKALKDVDISQFIDYEANVDFFYGCDILETLSLKNFNYNYDFSGVILSNPQITTVSRLFGLNHVGYNSIGLTSLTIEYMSEIPDYFAYDLRLESFSVKYFGGTGVGAESFSSCNFLKNIDFSKSLTYVDLNAFYGTPITQFDMSRLTYIGSGAFSHSNLVSIVLPAGITSLSERVFSYCSNLTQVTIEGNLTDIGLSAFQGCKKLTSFEFSTVVNIGRSAFYDCSSLKNVIFSQELEIISDEAFSYCSALSSIAFNSSAVTIGDYAFRECQNLTTVNFSDSVLSIGDNAFQNCNKLVSLVLPDSLERVGYSAFIGCTSLEEITLPFVGESPLYDGQFYYIFGSDSYIPSRLEKITVTSQTSIGDYAFSDLSNVREIIFKLSFSRIGNYAFYNCKKLNNFIISSGVGFIGENAFLGCYKLYEIVNLSYFNIRKGAEEHGMAGFYAIKVHTSLSSQKIPFAQQGNYIFYFDEDALGSGEWYLSECRSTSEVMNLPAQFYYGGYISSYSIRDYLLKDDSKVKTLVVSDSVNRIGVEAFYNCYNLTSVSVPAGVGEIGFNAFGSCLSLYSISLPFIGRAPSYSQIDNFSQDEKRYDFDTSYFSYIFGAYYSFDSAMVVPVSLKQVTIINVNFIPDYAFASCSNIEDITISASVRSIGKSAFAQTRINRFSFPNSLEEIRDYAFDNCSMLARITLPQSLRTIGVGAFVTNINLKSVTFAANSISVLPEIAFMNCNSLQTVQLPDGLTKIGNSAFEMCQQLNSISLPSSLTAIADRAFYSCLSLSEVYNFSSINLIAGASNNGLVSFYALRVNKSVAVEPLEYTMVNGHKFVLFGGKWYLVYMSAYASLPSSFTYESQLISSYILLESALDARSWHQLQIPRAVESIVPNTLNNYSITIVYYEGNASEWAQLILGLYSSPLYTATVNLGPSD